MRYMRDQPVRRSFPSHEKVVRGTMDKRLRRMLQALFTMTILILIRYFIFRVAFACIPDGLCRTVYRLIEFKDGFHGKVISTQWLFGAWSFYGLLQILIVIITGDYADVFDGVMIALAMFILNLIHPGTYLRNDYAAVPLYNERYGYDP